MVPRTGRAEKLKLHEAIPPFSLMVSSIHGKRLATLVKTVKSCSLQLCPRLVLTIPIRTCAPSVFFTVKGPPLSPCVENKFHGKEMRLTLHGPAAAPPAQTIRSSSTCSGWLILSRHFLFWTMGTTVFCRMSLDVPSSVSPHPKEVRVWRPKQSKDPTVYMSQVAYRACLSSLGETGRAEDW